jgi:tetratricopeptide (TPR) repeat protein
VASNRAATLKTAEKYLRQGKVDLAIAEYLRVVEEDPRDWNTANVLGDLYVRTGRVDKAVEQFIRIAEHLSNEGFLPKAGALYKKVLKIQPDHEHALLQAAEIAGSLGLLADARSYLNAVLERRRSRGDDRGVAQIKVRLGSLDPADVAARLEAARARVQLNDPQGAVRDFKELAGELSEQGKPRDALGALEEAAALVPDDLGIKAQMLEVYVAAGDYARARECATTSEQLKGLASRLETAGKPDEALEALRRAAALDPADADLRAHLARAFVGSGDLAAAAEYLTVETAGDDPKLLFMVAEILLRGGRVADGLAVVERLLADDPSRRENVAMLGWSVAQQAPDAGFQVVERAADHALSHADCPAAAAALQEFVTRVPNHVPALMRLVEICVDGGLEATMYSAQAQLADAYITAGMAAEARFIAEDLVAREPWERANVERFRRALVLMGETAPDAVIAERLSGQSPFTSTDLAFTDEELVAASGPRPEAGPEPAAARDAESRDATVRADGPRRSVPANPFELGANAVDLGSILGEVDTPQTVAHARTETVEVDLSIVLADIQKPGPLAATAADPGLDDVFAQLRDEAARRSALDVAEEQFRQAMALHGAGKIDECILALQAASRAPRLRFATASLLGRIYLERGMKPQAIESFERAAEAPAPSMDEGRRLLYDLADALESVGEAARALAVFMELQAEAGDYRDISERILRLSAQARG